MLVPGQELPLGGAVLHVLLDMESDVTYRCKNVPVGAEVR
jgi:hypothetical protein